MKRDELEAFLNGATLQATVDIRTLLLDRLKTKPVEQLEPLFYDELAGITPEELARYRFMSRG